MSEFLARIPSRDFLPIMFFLGAFAVGGLIAIATVAASAWGKHRAREMNAAMIEAMLAQGMGVDEIERVLKAADLSDKENLLRETLCRKFRRNRTETAPT